MTNAQNAVISVVVPLFNEEEVLSELMRRVEESARSLQVPFEIVAVNDGSSDNTLPLLMEISRRLPELRIINLFRNFGHMPALSAGLSLAKGEAVVAMDGDLQDPPELIPQFVAKWRTGADIVYGLRTHREESFFQRKATALFYWLLAKLSERPIPKQAGTFCLMNRTTVDLLNRMPERDRYFAGLRAWVGGTQSFVTYERPPRAAGKSRVGTAGLIRLGKTALFSFSKIPLRYASLFSLLFGLALFVVGLTAIVKRLFTNLAIPGWATTTTLLGMIGFVQSLLWAIMSEYIATIFDEIKARPLFIVREEIVGGQTVQAENDEVSSFRKRESNFPWSLPSTPIEGGNDD